jgi:hypothetical protein
MKTELVAETSENLHMLARLSAEKIAFKRGNCCGKAVRKISAAYMKHHSVRVK